MALYVLHSDQGTGAHPTHHDQHDGECLARDVWETADSVEPTTRNVALTVVWA
jgi:hypothetical protein